MEPYYHSRDDAFLGGTIAPPKLFTASMIQGIPNGLRLPVIAGFGAMYIRYAEMDMASRLRNIGGQSKIQLIYLILVGLATFHL